MKRMGRGILAMLGVYHNEMVEYRAEIILWLIATCFPLILLGVWVKAAGNSDLPLSQIEMARYFIAMFIVRNLATVWVVYEFQHQVNEGRLTPYLLQPFDVGWRHLAMHIAEKATRFPFLAGIVFIVLFFYPDVRWTPTLHDLAASVVVIIMLFLLRFITQYAITMLAFWTERAQGVTELWFLPEMFLSGMIAPLDIYPQAMQDFLWYTPFPYYVYFPIQVITGQAQAPWTGIGIMALWALAFFIIQRFAYRAGLKQYSAMGA